ncbi:MAG: alcohol dehydrogenase catalytic domain-containing protein [Microthrixaceae bacterium]
MTRFEVGDRVLTASVAGCGHCAGCATNDPVTCVDGPLVFGSGFLPGGQADAVAVPGADFQLLRIPEGIDDEAALLLTDNLCTGWIGAKKADVGPGSTVVVIGLGAVGLCAVRSAIAFGRRAGAGGRPGRRPQGTGRGRRRRRTPRSHRRRSHGGNGWAGRRRRHRRRRTRCHAR